MSLICLYLATTSDAELAEQKFQSGHSIYQSGDYQGSKAKFEEVISLLEQAILLNPQHINAYCYKAHCLQSKSFFQEAINCYNTALELDPRNYGALQQRGNCYRALGQLTEGLSDLDLSIQIRPDVLYGYYIRSLIHFSLGNYQQANLDFITAKPCMPTNPYFLEHERKLQLVLQSGQNRAPDKSTEDDESCWCHIPSDSYWQVKKELDEWVEVDSTM